MGFVGIDRAGRGLWICAIIMAVVAHLLMSAQTRAFAQEAENEPEAQQEEAVSSSSAENEEAAGDASVDGDVDAVGDEADAAPSEDISDDDASEDDAEVAKDWGRFQPIADLVEAGGPIIIILGALSVLSLAIAAVKLAQFVLLRPGDYGFVRRVSKMLADGHNEDALDLVSRRRGVVARVMETALRGRKIGADGVQLREEVERVARMKLDGLESGLPFLSLIATISPLLGLLGTVLGMIEAFQQLETAGDRVDPAILSGGIWEALLTTAAGLSVAIPAAALYTWLQRTVDVAGQHMEDAATRVFTADIYANGEAKRPKRSTDSDSDED